MNYQIVDPKLKYETIGYLSDGSFGTSTLVQVRSNESNRFVMKKIDIMFDTNQYENFNNHQQQQQLLGNSQVKIVNRKLSIASVLNSEKDRIFKLIKSFIKLSFHENIVYMIDSFLAKESLSIYTLTEYCKEDSLKAKLHKLKLMKTHIPDDMIFKWFTQTVSAVKYLHSNGVLHGNIKPKNFLLTSNGEKIKLTDFGYLSLFSNKQQKSFCINKLIRKNYDYLPKETVELHEYTHLSDIYSIGCIFFEIIFLERYHWSNEYALIDLKLRCSDEHFSYLLTSMLSVNSIIRPNINNVYRFCELKSNFYFYENQKIETKQPEAVSSLLASTTVTNSEWTANATQSLVSMRTDQRPPSRQKTADNIVLNPEIMIIPTNKLQLIKRNLFVVTYLTTKKEVNESQQTTQVGKKTDSKDEHEEQAKKFILKQIQLNDKNLKNMQNQLVKVNMLNHNNLMQMFNCVCISKRLYILIEYQYNGSLSRLIFEQRIKGQPFPENLVLQWLLQIQNGLEYLHSNSIIHTNLKCENILFTQNNLLKLTDFGYNYLLQKFDSNMILNNFSVEYSAPEIIYSNGDKYSVKSDIYSFGAVLCKCLTFRDYQQLLDMQDKEDIEVIPTTNPKGSIIKKRKNSMNKIKVNETSFSDYNAAKTVTFCDGTKGENEWNEQKQREKKEKEEPSVDYRRFLVEKDEIYSSKDYEYKLKMLGIDYSFSVRQTIIDMLNEKPVDRPSLDEILLNLRNLVSVNFSKLTTLKPLTTILTGKIETVFSRNYLPASTFNDFVVIAKQNEKLMSSSLIKFVDYSNPAIDAVKVANLNQLKVGEIEINSEVNQNVLKSKLYKSEIPYYLPQLVCSVDNDYLMGCDSEYFYLIDENFKELRKLDLFERLQQSQNGIDYFIEINREKLSTTTKKDRINLNFVMRSLCYDNHSKKIYLLVTIQDRCSLLFTFDIEISVYTPPPLPEMINPKTGKPIPQRRKLAKTIYFEVKKKAMNQIAINSQGEKVMHASKSYLFILERERLIRAYNKINAGYIFCIKSQSNKENINLDSFRTKAMKERTIENITKFLTLNNNFNNPVDMCVDVNGNLYLACPTAIEVYNEKVCNPFIMIYDM